MTGFKLKPWQAALLNQARKQMDSEELQPQKTDHRPYTNSLTGAACKTVVLDSYSMALIPEESVLQDTLRSHLEKYPPEDLEEPLPRWDGNPGTQPIPDAASKPVSRAKTLTRAEKARRRKKAKTARKQRKHP